MSIRKEDAAYITLEAAGRLFIQQENMGFKIHLEDQILEDIWLGVPVLHGMHFMYWKDAMRILADALAKPNASA